MSENILAQRSIYTPYRDTGIFGNCFGGNVKSIMEAINVTRGII